MLQGRILELERIGNLIDNAGRGRGGALLITGEPGAGKTALLEAALASAGGVKCLKSTPIKVEAKLPYAALGDIVPPILNELDRIPTGHARAIESALAIEPSPVAQTDRFATCAAFLGLLTAAAEREPLLIAVDDAQWLDAPSAECLAYSVRRLAGCRIALVATAREGLGGDLVSSGSLERLELPGLGDDEARTILRESVPDATSGVLDWLVEMSSGNPLALHELPAGLSADQRRGLEAIDHAPMTTARLRDTFEAKLRGLEPDARAALVVASAAFDQNLTPTIAACSEIGISTSALEAAEAVGAVVIEGQQLRFSHPLVKAAAYELSSASEHRRAHAALANHTDADSRAWHLAAATLGKDDEVAGLLEAASFRASARAAHSVAVDAMQRAADFTVDPLKRSMRIWGAAMAAALAGAFARSAALFESCSKSDDPLLRARGLHGLSLIKLSGGMDLPPEAPSELHQGAGPIGEKVPELAAAMHADAALLGLSAGQLPLAAEAVESSREVLPDDASPTIKCQVEAIAGLSRVMGGDPVRGRRHFDLAGDLLAEIDALSPLIQSIICGFQGRLFCGQEETWRQELERLIAMARENDTFGLHPFLLTLSADAAYRTGDWPFAESNDAVPLCEEYGQLGVLPVALGVRGRLRAARGRSEAAASDLRRATEIAEEGGAFTIANVARAATGFLELGDGRPDKAVAELEQVSSFANRAGLRSPVLAPWASDLVEAYVRVGQETKARTVSKGLEREAKKGGSALASAYSARCLGLVQESGFTKHFEAALEHHERAMAPFETARTRLLYGLRLHRANRRVEGRKQLRAARAIFEELDAEPWVEQAKTELRSAGAINRDPIADPDELSPQEIRVAKAVAEGATNRQVAARMYLSPKTIDFHLGRVYRKLDIHSRAELATMVAEGALDRDPDGDSTRSGQGNIGTGPETG